MSRRKPMWLVLCRADDLSALWAWKGLKARGVEPLELVTSEGLASGLRWNHRVGRERPSTALDLADGRRIRCHDVRGVLNRIAMAPESPWSFATAADREYAFQEVHAFYASW